jgi:hypothetical protein
MIEIIKEREYVIDIGHELLFVWKNDKGSGFSFPCDEKGNYIPGTPESQVNYLKCVSGEYDVVFEGVRSSDNSYWEDAIGRCICGEEIQLGRFTNTCDGCGRDYNSSGQLLASRDQWGEETGESYADIEGPFSGEDW